MIVIHDQIAKISKYDYLMNVSNNFIIVKCSKYNIYIEGNSFEVSYYSKEEVIFKGNIKKVELKDFRE